MQISLLYSKKVDGQAFKSAEVQMSAGEFSHGPDFSTKILFLRLALERMQWVPVFSNFFAPLTLQIWTFYFCSLKWRTFGFYSKALLSVRYCQVLLRSSFLPKCQPEILRISALPSNKLSGQKFLKSLVGILRETMTSKIHSEFNWPLRKFVTDLWPISHLKLGSLEKTIVCLEAVIFCRKNYDICYEWLCHFFYRNGPKKCYGRKLIFR